MATDTKRYSQSRLIFGDIVIICDGFKTSFKKESKSLTSTESSNAYDNLVGKETIEWEASDIDPALRKTLKKYYDDEIKVTLANCCKPVNGDEVIGYITRGNGIVVHRCNCHNIMDVEDRIIPIEWNTNTINKYSTAVIIKMTKKDNVLVDIISKASTHNVTVQSINLINNSDYQTYNLLVIVENVTKLNEFLKDLYQMPEIIEVERLIQ